MFLGSFPRPFLSCQVHSRVAAVDGRVRAFTDSASMRVPTFPWESAAACIPRHANGALQGVWGGALSLSVGSPGVGGAWVSRCGVVLGTKAATVQLPEE